MATQRRGNRVLMTVSIDADLARRIDRLAEMEGESRSRTAEVLIRESIDGRELGIKMVNDPVLSSAIAGAVMKPDVMKALAGSILGDLNDDQLKLFQQSMDTMSRQGHVALKSTPRPPAPKKKRK